MIGPDEIESLARAIRKLGLNDAGTPMGAIELLAKEVKGLAESVATGAQEVAGALDNIAESIDNKTKP